MDYEQTMMELLINAGEARSSAMMAIQCARKRDWTGADAALAASDTAAKAAHKIQTALIGADEGSGKLPVTLILVHAQDHLMTSMLARELVAELIELHEKMQ